MKLIHNGIEYRISLDSVKLLGFERAIVHENIDVLCLTHTYEDLKSCFDFLGEGTCEEALRYIWGESGVVVYKRVSKKAEVLCN